MMSTSAGPSSHGLEKDVVLAARVHEQRGLERGLGQAAERKLTARHRSGCTRRVEEVLREPDAVAEQGALRKN